ncbi:MAG: response regulator [Lachnospiraceae bacterium]|nr:response regulator [Lachnospiraceae bacterium]
MKYVFSVTLFTCCILALFMGIYYCITKEKKYLENRLFSLFCMSSAIWSFGFGGIFIQTSPDAAYIWRAFGMIGVFLYLITAQMIVCHLSHFKKSTQNIFNGIALTGIPIYFFVVQRNQTVFYLSESGMTYHFHPGIWNTIYTLYSIIIPFNLMITIICILRNSTAKRMQAFCKRFLIAELIIFLGMILDTICPLLGIPAIPGSTLSQFAGLLVLFYALTEINHSRINVSNMSEILYHSLSLPVLVFDSNKKLRILNDAAHTFFNIGREKDAYEGLKLQDLFDLDNMAFDFTENRRDIDATCSRNWLYCNLVINRIHDSYGDTNGYTILVTDLSERVKTMQDLEEATIEAKCANQAKSTFLANMSHEIRTPMNAIIGFSELILKMELSPEVREYVQDIKSSSHNLLAIINDILDISKIESGKMELVCASYYMKGLLGDVALIIANQAEKKGLEFTMQVDPNIPNKLYGDKIRIRAILVNILNNAVKYTKKGSISFETRLLRQTGDNIALEFKISDTGVGIKKENLDTLFQSFSQLDQSIHYGVEGSGLGLAIVKGYTALMDGTISVDSTYGKGSVFTVILEQKVLDTELVGENFTIASAQNSESSIGDMKISGKRVLVVDDNHVNLKVAGNSLSYYGLTVDTAICGKDAVELCKNNHYDIVFLDHMMPEMDGVKTMKQIRKLAPCYAAGGTTKIIVLTANAVSGARNLLMSEGFDEYLGKPINYKQLERLFVRFLPPECISYEEKEPSSIKSTSSNEDILYLQKTLPDVDITQGMDNCGGALKDYLSVLEIAWRYGSKQLEELKDLFLSNDVENYTIKVHSLKSMAKNLGANTISEMALLQEKAGKSNDWAFIAKHTDELQSKQKVLLEKIEEVLLHFEQIEPPSELPEEIFPEEQVRLVLMNIVNCVDNFDFTKVFTILDEMKKCRLEEKYQDVFSQIEEFMDELAVDEVRQVIQNVL